MHNFKQYLEEGRDAPLYHGTTVESVGYILKQNILKPGEQLWINDDKYKYVSSFTRSERYAYEFATEHWQESLDGIVVFKVDQRKIAQRHKIGPASWLFADMGEDRGTRPDGWINQSEERVVGTIRKFSQYILSMNVKDYKRTLKYVEKNKWLKEPELFLKHPLLYDVKTKKWVNK